MLRATANPRFRVSRRSESDSLRTKNVTAVRTSPTTTTPNVRKMRAWSPPRPRRGSSAGRASTVSITLRLREAELLHGHGRDAERVHLQPDHVVPQPDEVGRVVERHERGLAQDALLGTLVRVLAE